MFVKSRMTANPYTISYDDSIIDLMELMHEKKLKRVPVVKGDKVVGIVTNGDLKNVSPNKATTLSIWEVNYLLAKTPVSTAMTKEVVTVSPDSLLEEAAVLMRSNRVSALAVVDQERLVGIITESDIFDAYIDLLGSREIGTRITIQAEDIPGNLSKLTNLVSITGANITHLVVYRGTTNISDVVIRVNTLQTEDLITSLNEHGFKVIHVQKNHG